MLGLLTFENTMNKSRRSWGTQPLQIQDAAAKLDEGWLTSRLVAGDGLRPWC